MSKSTVHHTQLIHDIAIVTTVFSYNSYIVLVITVIRSIPLDSGGGAGVWWINVKQLLIVYKNLRTRV